MYAWVQEQVAGRGLEPCVHLVGRHPQEKMPVFFSRSDALLVSLKHDPAFAVTIPGKVPSYLASGKPVIAALDGEGARLINESGAGVTCRAEDPEQLAQAVLRLYQTPRAAREKMGKAGVAYCSAHFDREMLLDKLEEIFADL